MTLSFTRSKISSPIGALHVIANGPALVALDFEGFEDRMMRLLNRRFPRSSLTPGVSPPKVVSALESYFSGDLSALDTLEVYWGGTPFQAQVWSALRSIPAGQTMGYGGLAAVIGKPSASRAVGLANGSNPIAIVVPCHRVIGANLRLTGYAGGLERKKFLLSHEGATFRE